jgi:hypothetical protein
VTKNPIGSSKSDPQDMRNAMSVISAQPVQFYPYQQKLMLKDINEYILMENNMIALLTIPQSDSESKGAYPRLLIMALPDIFTNQSNENSKFLIYEVPSSLHLIDLKKAQFLTSNNTLICLYGRDIIYWEITRSYAEETPGLLVNYSH